MTYYLKVLFVDLMDSVLFIKALQRKCLRSVGYQVLQPAKDKDIEFRKICLKSCRQEKKSKVRIKQVVYLACNKCTALNKFILHTADTSDPCNLAAFLASQ